MPINNEENRKIVEKAVYLYKIDFVKAAEKSNAKINYLGQHSLIWGALGANGFDRDFWMGLCAGLAIEWTKYRVAGNNFLSTLSSARTEVFLTPEKERKLIATLKVDVERSHYCQRRLTTALKGSCVPTERSFKSRYPFNNAYSSLVAGYYYYVSSGSHATAMYVNKNGSIDFYDPNIGEALGIKKKDLQHYMRAAKESTCKVEGKDFSTLQTQELTIIELRAV